MARKHVGPWLRKSDLNWYTTVKGKLVKLGTAQDSSEAIQRAYLAAHGVSDIQVADLIQDFLPYLKRSTAPASYRFYSAFLREASKHSAIGRSAASTLSPSVVGKWIEKRYGHLSNSTQRGASRSITRLYTWAVKEGVLASSPVKGLHKPKDGARTFLLTNEQYAKCLKHAGPHLKVAIKFLKHTGCRPQEMRAIEAKWIQDGKIVFPYKIKEHNRVLYLDSMAERIVVQLAELHPRGPIFRQPRGKPWSSYSLGLAIRKLRNKIGVAHLCAYSFRHAFITHLLERGIDPATVAAISGNSVKMVLEVYCHVSRNEQRLALIVRTNAVA